MEKRVVIVSLLLMHAMMCWSTSRLNSRRFRWDDDDYDDDEDIGEAGRLHVPASPQEREDRKLIFINNKAYDLSEEEQARVWDLYLKKGHPPKTDEYSKKPQMDSLSSAMDVAQGEAEVTQQHLLSSTRFRQTPAADGDNNSLNEAVKASRFVADPQKAQLIEKVDEEEMNDLRSSTPTTTTTPTPVERVATEGTVETSTVLYEYTKVSVLAFLWNEVKNIGDLLGREMIGSVAGTLSYLWESLVQYVKARGRRALQDMSNEL